MKILQINKFFYRRRGAETYLFDLSAVLRAKGHDVAEFAMQHPENETSPWSQYFVSPVDYSGSSVRKNVKAAMRMLWSREAQHKLEMLLDQFQPDVAHLHNIYHQLSPSILNTLKKRGIPIVLTLHDYKLICPNYELFTENEICNRCKGHRYYNAMLHNCVKDSKALSALAMFEMYLHKALQVYEKQVDCFISPSQFLRNQIMDWGEQVKRLEVIPNFISLDNHHKNEPGVVPMLSTDFLYAGSLSRAKGVDVLLDNFMNNRYSSRLLLAGSGPLEGRLKAQAHNNANIVFLGQLSKAQLQHQLRSCRAVIVPSRLHDNFPYAVLEAFAAGKPVIGSQRGGIPELVQHRQTGWLFEPTKPDSLTAALTEAIHNDALVSSCSVRAIAVARQHNPEHHYETLLAVYQSLIA